VTTGNMMVRRRPDDERWIMGRRKLINSRDELPDECGVRLVAGPAARRPLAYRAPGTCEIPPNGDFLTGVHPARIQAFRNSSVA
jgi:hypothetical protein